MKYSFNYDTSTEHGEVIIDGEKVGNIRKDTFITIFNEIISGENDYIIENGTLYRRLDHMPYDQNGHHATGWEYLACNYALYEIEGELNWWYDDFEE